MRALCGIAALAIALIVTPTRAEDLKSGPDKTRSAVPST